MTGLEVLFITNVIILFAFWGWFVFMGFNTGRAWGWGLLFLFPVSAFVFAYRFERKTRKVIYYFVLSLFMFGALNGWIYFATIDFFPRFSHKLAKLAPDFGSSNQAKTKTNLNLPKPTPIPEPLTVASKPVVEKIKKSQPTVKKYRYTTVNIESARSYIGKKVIISTAFVVHRGVLKSVGMGQIEIRKELEGGTILMGVPKSKIEKFEVYL